MRSLIVLLSGWKSGVLKRVPIKMRDRHQRAGLKPKLTLKTISKEELALTSMLL